LTIAQVVAVVGLLGLALFVAPLLVARETYHRYVRLRVAYSDTVRSLVGAIEAKDPYTKGHSVRVSEYAVQIAKRLALDDQMLTRIERAALLHDLGKVGVSRALLAKEGTLTQAEWAEIRRHPDIGAGIMETVPYLKDIVPIVQYHHERIDGGGYCEGLSGDDIPFAARILAVADSYDAMTSIRPYRRALARAEALDELHAGAGTQFDSTVVAAMEGYLSETSSLLVGTADEAVANA
jgi:HD-GYP domain-containing protein (c-di-GMP phosphodiesterase class II)